MARYEHLPIYKKTFDLLIWTEQTVRRFARYHKYTVGADLRNSVRKALTTIVEANSSRQKGPVLERLRVELETLMLLVRVVKEVKAFNNLNSYQYAAGEILGISRQNEGWLRSLDGKLPESPRDPQQVAG